MSLLAAVEAQRGRPAEAERLLRNALALQPQKYTVLLSTAVNLVGTKGPPLWLPSQNGWFLLLPQAHHQ